MCKLRQSGRFWRSYFPPAPSPLLCRRDIRTNGCNGLGHPSHGSPKQTIKQTNAAAFKGINFRNCSCMLLYMKRKAKQNYVNKNNAGVAEISAFRHCLCKRSSGALKVPKALLSFRRRVSHHVLHDPALSELQAHELNAEVALRRFVDGLTKLLEIDETISVAVQQIEENQRIV